MKPELKPCKRCGSIPKIVSRPVAQRKSEYDIQCTCGERTGYMDRQYKAVDAWNKNHGIGGRGPEKCGEVFTIAVCENCGLELNLFRRDLFHFGKDKEELLKSNGWEMRDGKCYCLQCVRGMKEGKNHECV